MYFGQQREYLENATPIVQPSPDTDDTPDDPDPWLENDWMSSRERWIIAQNVDGDPSPEIHFQIFMTTYAEINIALTFTDSESTLAYYCVLLCME